MSKKKGLIIISDLYPKGNGEHFLEKEIHYFSKEFDQIYIFPLTTETSSNHYRKLPENCEMDLRIAQRVKLIRLKIILQKSGLILSILIKELIYHRKLFRFMRHAKEHLSLLIQNIESAMLLHEFILTKQKEFHFSHYAVWNDEASLVMGILKEDEKIDSFFMRVHGHELYNERSPDHYLAFKHFKLNQSKKVHVLSNQALEYLLQEGFPKEKLQLSTFGTFNPQKTINPISSTHLFRMVSCSHLIPLKQVDKIAKAIQLLDFPVEWIHFGDGGEKNKIEGLIGQFQTHQKGALAGDKLNEEILDYYQKEQINLFIHLSETEGLGVALIEAISFGIPLLALDSGGVRDIVKEETGILLPLESSIEKIAATISSIRESALNKFESRAKIQNYWNQHFNAEIIYSDFAKDASPH